MIFRLAGVALVGGVIFLLVGFMGRVSEIKNIAVDDRPGTLISDESLEDISEASNQTMDIQDNSSADCFDGICKKRGAERFLTLCTTVKNSVHFIVEWIEFMRIQGVDRFIFYDDKSTDDLALLVPFYEKHAPELDLRILPMANDGMNHFSHILNLQDCLTSYGRSTEWLVNSDAGEFLFSPSYETLRTMLEDIPRLEKDKNVTIQHLHAPCHSFGAMGQVARSGYRLEQQPDGTVLYRNGCGEQLLINKVRRAPSRQRPGERELWGRLQASPACTCAAERFNVIGCHQHLGRSIMRPQHIKEVRAAGAAAQNAGSFGQAHSPSFRQSRSRSASPSLRHPSFPSPSS